MVKDEIKIDRNGKKIIKESKKVINADRRKQHIKQNAFGIRSFITVASIEIIAIVYMISILTK